MNTHFVSVKRFVLVLLVLIFTSCGGDSSQQSDPVAKSLVVMGDLQIGAPNWQATQLQNPSSTNIPQLDQTVVDIAALPNKPDYSFILGDLVVGFMLDNGQVLRTQLDGWIAAFQGFPGSAGIHVVPLPGNHEMDYYDPTQSDEAPNPVSYLVWNNWIATNQQLFPFEANGPKPGGANPDQLVQDESHYTFSFNWGAVHIVAINTDTLTTVKNPATDLVYQGWIPINWIAADLAAAQANPAVSAILVMGHRPIEVPPFVPPMPNYGNTMLDLEQHPLASELAALLQHTPKVKAYLCSHVHLVDARKLTVAPHVWQIISGNGGAELLTNWSPAGGQFFGFSEVRLHRSGHLSVAAYGRALPPPTQAFYLGTPVAPAPAVERQVVELE